MKEFSLDDTHFGRYLRESRGAAYQLILFLPLLVFYEVAAVIINFDTPFQLRNGADILVKYTLHFLGIRGVFGFVMTVLLFVSLMIVAAVRRHAGRLKTHYFAGLIGESLLYSVFIGVASARLTGIVMKCNPFLATGGGTTFAQQVMIGIGAGVYEEIVFRVLLITMITGILYMVGMDGLKRAVLAVFVSAVLFAAFHYVGEFGESFDAMTFVYRTIAGVLLAAIYVSRGIGVSAWSHAMYDVLIVSGVM